jgi:magnesium transporter
MRPSARYPDRVAELTPEDAASRRTCLVQSDGRVRAIEGRELEQIDQLRQVPGTLVWLDILNPDAGDLALLREEFEVHPLAIEDLDRQRQRPKLDTYGEQHVIVAYEVHSVAEEVDRADRFGEIHLFAGPGYLVSARWARSPAIEQTKGRFLVRPETVGKSVGALLYAVLDAIVDGYFPVIDELNDRVDELEDQLLGSASDPDGLRRLLGLKRTMLELRRIVAPLRDVTNALLRREVPIIDDQAIPYLNDLYDHLVRVIDSLDLLRDLVAATLDANLAATNNSLNAVMKRLTAFTVVIMLPTLVAGIYGMNFHVMPELEWPFGYPLALGLMAATVVAAIAYFRRHGWF